jgi:hypothetical protein
MLPRLNALRVEAGLRDVRSPLEQLYRPDRRVVVTLADAHGVGSLSDAPNARIERFVPHGSRSPPACRSSPSRSAAISRRWAGGSRSQERGCW